MTPQDFRRRFPSLERTVHLASCSLGARSTDLDGALDRMLDDMAEGGAPWGRFTEQVELARHRFAALVGARPDQVSVQPNASVAAYQVASTADYRMRHAYGTRDTVLTSSAEFPSIGHVWRGQRRRGARILSGDAGQDLSALMDRRTRFVSVPLTGYQDAERQPVAELSEAAHAAGAEIFVDAYQAAGVEPIDVGALDCDHLVAGTGKYLLGLPGLAFLYSRSPALTDRDPRLTGWFGRVDPFAFDPERLDFPETATRFETGTPAVAACYTAAATLDLIGRLDLAAVREHVLDLADLAAAVLADQGEQVRLLPRARRGAHLGLLDPDPAGLAAGLAARGVATSPRGDVVRLAFHYYSNADDVAALAAALQDVRRSTRRASGPVTPLAG